MQMAAMNVADEGKLLERARELDPAALEAVYDHYSPLIYNYLYRRLGDADLVEDLVAQVFLRMLEAIEKGQAWRTSFSGWLYRIAHNLVVDHFRRRSRGVHVSLDDAPPLHSPRGNPVEIADRNLARERLAEAMQQLTQDQALVVSMRFLEEYSIAEVAGVLGKSEGAIKALQYRAVLALRDIMVEQPTGS
ncbi:MAG TPA: sigma-70 family RNA polymerase sigma factor [Anaerolineae bacterium]|jgi:RNA polymerase sigma-70 factor (ECF subfamily)|nr:sigma-70 family RNA polymerase sigma factor [Anaerolineae bacterium]